MSNMHNRLTLIIVATLLLYSAAGKWLASRNSHVHLLIGSVTPEELRAHEVEEEREGQPLVVTYPATDDGMTVQGGVIVSLLYGPDMSNIPVALDGAFPTIPALVSTICYSVSFSSLPEQPFARSPLDPPPRFTFTSA